MVLWVFVQLNVTGQKLRLDVKFLLKTVIYVCPRVLIPKWSDLILVNIKHSENKYELNPAF